MNTSTPSARVTRGPFVLYVSKLVGDTVLCSEHRHRDYNEARIHLMQRVRELSAGTRTHAYTLEVVEESPAGSISRLSVDVGCGNIRLRGSHA